MPRRFSPGLIACIALLSAAPHVYAQRIGGRTEAGGGNRVAAGEIRAIDVAADTILQNHKITLDKHAWRFRLGDDIAWTSAGYYDNDWATVVPDEEMSDSLTAIARTGLDSGEAIIGWFRIHLRIDPRLVRRPVVLEINPHGAAEIYLNGELVYSSGGDVTLPGRQARVDRPALPIPVTFSSTNAVIAVRYNLGSQLTVRPGLWDKDLFHVAVANEALLATTAAQRRHDAGVALSIFGLFAAIGFIHLLLFLFLRQPRSNLYFGIFAALFALFPLDVYFSAGATNFRTGILLDQLGALVVGPAMFALIVFLYSVFLKRRPVTFWPMAAITVALMIVPFALGGRAATLAAWLVLAVFALEGLRVLTIAVINRREGARIIAVGFALTFATWIVLAILIARVGNFPVDLFWGSFLGISLSSSVFLARGFANHALGFRRLSHELSDVNRSLEAKVADRTAQLEERAAIEGRRADEQRALLDTMADLSGELELEKVLEHVLERAVHLLGVTGGELAIYDESAGELEVVAAHNIGSQAVGVRLKLGEGAMGVVAKTRQSLIIPDYRKWDARSDKYRDSTARGVMAAPLLIGDRLVGVLASIHTEADRQFGEEDLRLLEMFAPQAAIAIENARLFTEAERRREYFQAVFENSPVAIVSIDLDGAISSFNTAFERMFGFTRDEAIGQNIDELIATEEGKQAAIDRTRMGASGEKVLADIGSRRRKDGGTIEVEHAGIPVEVAGQRVGIIALYHDVTELLRARREAEDASRTKSQFLANMSHELRTPLNAVIGYSEMLMEEAEASGDEGYLPDLKKIHSSGRHLLGLINDILDLSKIESGRMEMYFETFEVAPMVEEVATTIRPLIDKNGNTLVLDLAPDVGTVRLDQVKVRQILFNLLSNASKFTENGTITLAATRNGEHVSFRISDTGIGMTDDQMARLFQPFMQADASTTKKYGGTGLGLAITRRFCEMMGGSIELASEASQGTTFTVVLPTDGDMRVAEAERVVDAVAATGASSGTVLIIDDDATARDMLSRMLGREGYRIVLASSGEEGLRLAREERPDVITLDVLMAGLDGWGVLARLKADAATADIPVVVVTIIDDRNLGFALGAADYLTKPIERERLADALRRVRADERSGPVLVVDDDDTVREMLRRILEKDGWRVVEAENGRVALDCMLQHGPAVVLLDLMMPEMDGFTFLDEIRKRGVVGIAPIIVLTAKSLTEAERQRLQGAVSRVLQKGEQSAPELLQEIRRAMENSRKPAPAGGA